MSFVAKCALVFAIPALCAVSVSAVADDTELPYEAYKTLATDLGQRVGAREPLETLAVDTQTLIELGTEVLRAYGVANPNCAEQLAVVEADLATMGDLSVEAIHTKYHNGVGIPAGPRHCYFGRALVVHPVMNLVRFEDGLTAAELEAAEHEYFEVVGHIVRAQANIENPPN